MKYLDFRFWFRDVTEPSIQTGTYVQWSLPKALCRAGAAASIL